MEKSEIYKNKYERERRARKEAEKLLEEKSLELYYANQKLEKLNDELEQKVKDRSQELEEKKDEMEMFTYISSHDLKTPLRSISHISSWVEEDVGNEKYDELHKYTKLMRMRVNRMENLINSLIEYTSIDKNKFVSHDVVTESMVREILDYENKNQEFSWKILDDLPNVSASRTLLFKVFSNLIRNGLKYNTKELKEIKIGASKEGNVTTFFVRDNGNGIEDKYKHKIFSVFQTLERKDVTESSGIGLSIVKKIVMSNGGKVWFESELGVGSTFYFSWKS